MALLVACFSLSAWNVQQDDAYIFYSYADNIASGHGYVFNIAERVNATTSPLYTLLLAASYAALRWTTITLPVLGHAIGALSLFVFLALVAGELHGEGLNAAAWVFPPVLLLNPALRSAVGMETFLTLALCALTICLYQRGELSAAGIAAGFSVLSRPDSVLLVAVLGIHWLSRYRKLPPLRVVMAFAVPVAAWAGFAWFYFGSPVPITVAAKLGQTGTGYWGVGLLFLRGLSTGVFPAQRGIAGNGIVPLLYLLAAVYYARHWKRAPSRCAALIFAWIALYLLAYGLVLNPPGYQWYYVPVAVAPALAVALAIECARLPRARGWGSGFAVLALVLMFNARQGGVTDEYPRYMEVAAWMNEHAPTATLAAVEVGVLGYATKCRIVDALGLITPGGAARVTAHEYDWYVSAHAPDFVLVNDPPRRILETHTKREPFRRIYPSSVKFGRVKVYIRGARPAAPPGL